MIKLELKSCYRTKVRVVAQEYNSNVKKVLCLSEHFHLKMESQALPNRTDCNSKILLREAKRPM